MHFFQTTCARLFSSGRALLAAVLLLSSLQARAQVDNYQFAPSSGMFTPLPATATNVAAIQSDDALSGVIPIGFTFVFDGTPYTDIKASSNGWLTFNTAATGNSLTNDLDNGAAAERPRVAPYWDDMHGGQGTASYLTTGTAPNRVFTFEWLNWYRFGNTGGPTLSMQVQLFEGTNVVRFVYRQEPAGTFSGASASIGLSGAGMGSGSFLSLSNATATPGVSSVTEADQIADRPATGQIYQFTPPAPSPCPAPRNLTATVTNTTATVSYTVANSPSGPFTIVYGPNGFNPATGGITITGVSGTSTTISGLTPNTTYQFYVTQNCGGTNGNSTQSNPGSFTTDPAPATNNECATAIALPETAACTTPLNGTVLGATQSLPATTGCGTANIAANDVWYSFVASGRSQQLTLNPRFAAVLEVRSGTCANSSSLFCTTAFSGNTTPVLVSNLTAGQTYFLRVYANSATQPTGQGSTFTLCLNPGPPAPANDECASAAALTETTACTTPLTGTVAGATQSAGVTATAGCGIAGIATNDVWYSFVASGATQLLTLNPRFAAVLEVRSGTCASSSSIYCTTAFSGNTTGSVVGSLTSGQTYFVRIYANSAVVPTVANSTFTLCLNPGPTPPANDDCAGAIALAVTANCTSPVNSTVLNATTSAYGPGACAGTAPAHDVWYSFVATGTSQTLLLNPRFSAVMEVRTGTCANATTVFCGTYFSGNTAPALPGNLTVGQTYFVRIYNNSATAPTAANSTFTLCLTAGPAMPPANDECAGATVLPVTMDCTNPLNGTVLNASQSLLPSTCGTLGAAVDVWYRFVATGATQLVTLNSRFGAVLELRSGTCAASTAMSCNTIVANSSNGIALTGLSSGQTYFLRVYANSTAQPTAANATFTLCLNPGPAVPTNDECASATPLPVTTNCSTPTTGTVAAASQSLAPTASCGFGTVANDVWYSFTATSTAHLLNFAPAFSAVIDLRSGTCASSTSIYCNTATATAPRLAIVPGLTVGQTYFLRIYATTLPNPTGSSATFSLCVTVAPPAPANDDCAGAFTVPVQFGTTCQGYTAGDITSATASTGNGAADPVCGSYRGADIWFRTVVPATGTVTVRTVATSPISPVTDTGMALYSGACGSLVELGCNDNGTGVGLYSLLTLTNRTPGEVIYVRVWSFNNNTFGPVGVCVTSPSNCSSPTAPGTGTLTNTTAQLTWAPGTNPPAGATYTVEYGPMGFTPGTGTTITGITSTGTTLSGLSPATNYCFYVRQDCPSTGSSPFVGPTCFTTPLSAPNNDEPCGAISLSGNSLTGNNVGATTSLHPGISLPACSPAAAPKDVWFTMTPTGNSTTLSFSGNSAGMVRVYSAPSCNGPFTSVACSASPGNNQSVGTVNVTGLTPGQRYYVAVSGFGSSDTPGTFTVSGTALSSRAQAETNALLVFPNPSSSGQLTLRLMAGHIAGQATLLNALGQEVLRKAVSAHTAEQALSTRGLASGVYTLRVQLGSEVLTRKVVLE
ncbi:hypothetical protein GCM10023185_32490 [Hymenobacter saemangeumensis]|uniref:Fibronectin type-III domain-containing protein n=2 Tax=Hymenobacter saemangeumensis TaxID=1084522 RepID=A0ABP8INC3_9BACT